MSADLVGDPNRVKEPKILTTLSGKGKDGRWRKPGQRGKRYSAVPSRRASQSHERTASGTLCDAKRGRALHSAAIVTTRACAWLLPITQPRLPVLLGDGAGDGAGDG